MLGCAVAVMLTNNTGGCNNTYQTVSVRISSQRRPSLQTQTVQLSDITQPNCVAGTRRDLPQSFRCEQGPQVCTLTFAAETIFIVADCVFIGDS